MSNRTRYEFYVEIEYSNGTICELQKNCHIVKQGKGRRWKTLGHLKQALKCIIEKKERGRLFNHIQYDDIVAMRIFKEKVVLEPVEIIDGLDICREMQDPLGYKRKKGLESI